MGKFSLSEWFQNLKRMNSASFAGWVSGSITHIKAGKERNVILENNKIICFINGEEDIVIVYPYSKAIAQAEVCEVPVMNQYEVSYEELKAIPSERGTGALGSSGK